MVVGLDRLRSYFENYKEQYIIIGGTACELRLESRGIDFRATKDIDMLLIIEAVDKDFMQQFWQFISDGEYTNRFMSEEKKNFFRFNNPQADDFPQIVELFSRKPDGIDLHERFHLTPIPTDEEISSLSAILLDDDYYIFTINNCSEQDGLMIANEISLICLKAKAYLNNCQRKKEGQKVKSEDIEKHKKDVIKLIATLEGIDTVECPDAIKADLRDYIFALRNEKTDIAKITKSMKLGTLELDEIAGRLEDVFQLTSSNL